MTMRHFLHRLTRRCPWIDERGNAAIEFAIVLPMLMTMVVGTVDYGIAMTQQMEVQHAAQAGAEFAALHGFDSSQISNAVSNATALSGLSVSPAPTQACGCPSGSTISSVSCTDTCTSGATAGTYVTVSAQATYTTILPYPGIPNSFTLTGQSVVRIQ
jgi:Flp pilus assembly protein TadG